MVLRSLSWCLVAAIVAPPADGLASGSESKLISSYAARAALAALQDFEKAVTEMVVLEREAVDHENLPALEAFSFLQEHIGTSLESAAAAARHAAVAIVAESDPAALVAADLAEAAALDEQVSEILQAQVKESVFFWHGPKRLIQRRLDHLFGKEDGSVKGVWRSTLNSLAQLQGAPTAKQLLGEEPSAPKEVHPASGPIPALGLVLRVGDCKEDCDLLGTVKAVASHASKESSAGNQPVHLLLLPGVKPTSALTRELGEVQSRGPSIFISALLNVGWQVGPDPVKKELRTLLRGLRLKSLDLLWLPYEAFTKKNWSWVKELLAELTRGGHIKSYGFQAELATPKVIEGLRKRQPAPTAWLVHHDGLKPANKAGLEAAKAVGFPVVAVPRRPVGTLMATYLKAAGAVPAEASQAQLEAVQLQWVLGSGLRTTLPLSPELVRQILQVGDARRTDGPTSGLLHLLRNFTQPESRAASPSASREASPLLGALQEAKAILANAPLPKAQTNPPDVSATSPGFVPGISAAALAEVPTKRSEFQANNRVVYMENFFDEPTYAAILDETKRLWKSHDIEGNCNLDGVDRMGGYVLDHRDVSSSSLYGLIYGNEAFRRWVTEINHEGEMYPSDFPIELREYTEKSKGMGCHPDLQLYAKEKKDLEFAYTVENPSLCNTSFWDANGKNHVIHTQANSMIMVGVNAARHCVSSTQGGTRTLIKFIYVGDYRKSDEFWYYTDNRCGDDNPNRRAMDQRRASLKQLEAAGTQEL